MLSEASSDCLSEGGSMESEGETEEDGFVGSESVCTPRSWYSLADEWGVDSIVRKCASQRWKKGRRAGWRRTLNMDVLVKTRLLRSLNLPPKTRPVTL